MNPVMVIAELADGKLSDGTQELLTKGREVAAAGGASLVVVGFGPDARDALVAADADTAIWISGSAVERYVPTTYETAAATVLAEHQPSLVLIGNTTMGLDLGAGLAAHRNLPLIAYCIGLSAGDGGLTAQCQVYGGKLVAEVAVPEEGAVITVVPGSWAAVPSTGSPALVEVPVEAVAGMELVKVIEPEGGDVDITRANILVSVGRGIQGPENLELADELAEALGGVVSCSRPVVDAGWLPRTRQVGKSGLTVKPKLYLALGISGAPEHLQGMKDAELIIAVNSDENAPIMEVAHYGATADILEFMPALTEQLKALSGGA